MGSCDRGPRSRKRARRPIRPPIRNARHNNPMPMRRSWRASNPPRHLLRFRRHRPRRPWPHRKGSGCIRPTMGGYGSQRMRQPMPSEPTRMSTSSRPSTGGPGIFRLGARAPTTQVRGFTVLDGLARACGLAAGWSRLTRACATAGDFAFVRAPLPLREALAEVADGKPHRGGPVGAAD